MNFWVCRICCHTYMIVGCPPTHTHRMSKKKKKVSSRANSTTKKYCSPDLPHVLAGVKVFNNAAAAITAAAVPQHVVIQCEPALCKRLLRNTALNGWPCGKHPPTCSSQGEPLHSKPGWCESSTVHRQPLIVSVAQEVLQRLIFAHLKRLMLLCQTTGDH